MIRIYTTAGYIFIVHYTILIFYPTPTSGCAITTKDYFCLHSNTLDIYLQPEEKYSGSYGGLVVRAMNRSEDSSNPIKHCWERDKFLFRFGDAIGGYSSLISKANEEYEIRQIWYSMPGGTRPSYFVLVNRNETVDQELEAQLILYPDSSNWYNLANWNSSLLARSNLQLPGSITVLSTIRTPVHMAYRFELLCHGETPSDCVEYCDMNCNANNLTPAEKFQCEKNQGICDCLHPTTPKPDPSSTDNDNVVLWVAVGGAVFAIFVILGIFKWWLNTRRRRSTPPPVVYDPSPLFEPQPAVASTLTATVDRPGPGPREFAPSMQTLGQPQDLPPSYGEVFRRAPMDDPLIEDKSQFIY